VPGEEAVAGGCPLLSSSPSCPWSIPGLKEGVSTNHTSVMATPAGTAGKGERGVVAEIPCAG